MNAILFVTIEHSGTFETLHTLGWREDGSGRQVTPLEEWNGIDDVIVFRHLWDADMDRIAELSKTMKVVTTKRSLEQVRESWMTRAKDAAELEKQIANWISLADLNPTIIELGAKK